MADYINMIFEGERGLITLMWSDDVGELAKENVWVPKRFISIDITQMESTEKTPLLT